MTMKSLLGTVSLALLLGAATWIWLPETRATPLSSAAAAS